jgi:hypothetical protein
VRSETNELKVVFVGVGTEFEDKRLGPNDSWAVRNELSGLMFPNQGYILFLQREVGPLSTRRTDGAEAIGPERGLSSVVLPA